MSAAFDGGDIVGSPDFPAPSEGEIRRVQLGETHVLLARVEGVVYAVADRCTHGKASLSHGYLDGWEIECPLHQGRFDIRTGEATAPPCRQRLAVFRVRERGGTVQLIESTPAGN